MTSDLRFYWSILLRRLPVMLALAMVCTVFGVVSAIRAPATYSTSARLLVEAPQISEDRQRATDTPNAETLQVIEQQLMTRANLIDIANKLRVFDDPSLTPDQKVAAMREATTIRSTAGRDQATMMTVAFTGKSGAQAAAVVNEYTTLILSANTRDRVGRAEDRLSFFQSEVERLSADLDQQNKRILEFKRANADALPENIAYTQGRQSLLQERVARLESDLAVLQAQRDEMVRLFRQTGSIQPGGTVPLTPAQQQLAALQAELRDLQAVYTDSSPKVRALRARIKAAEAALGPGASAAVTAAPPETKPAEAAPSKTDAPEAKPAEAPKADAAPGTGQTGTPTGTPADSAAPAATTDDAAAGTPAPAPRAERPAPTGNAVLDVNLSQIDSRITAAETERAQAMAEMDRLQKAVAATSTNAIALQALERDQANIQSRYDAAVANLGEARTAERIEASSRGQRITVIEAASAPSHPSGPNRVKIAAMGVGLGLALAGGFFALLEMLNTAIRRPAELRHKFSVTPLAVIPYIETTGERRRRLSVGMGLVLAVLVLIPVALWLIHTQYMPLDILARKILLRLGLG